MFTLINVRNRHFLAAVKTIVDNLPAGQPLDIETVAARAALSPAPAYYCTFDYALRMLRVLRHGRLNLRRDRRLLLWTELNARASRIMEKRGVSLGEALASVLADGHASQFFISPSTASSIARRYFDSATKSLIMP
ncbi:MAG: hypothetical protein NC212_03560 [Staphylococcus sp.]|nr:hypothetical protein [Staphylococcus sp.]